MPAPPYLDNSGNKPNTIYQHQDNALFKIFPLETRYLSNTKKIQEINPDHEILCDKAMLSPCRQWLSIDPIVEFIYQKMYNICSFSRNEYPQIGID